VRRGWWELIWIWCIFEIVIKYVIQDIPSMSFISRKLTCEDKLNLDTMIMIISIENMVV